MGTNPSTRRNPTAEELDALDSGSIAIVLGGTDENWPEVFLRSGSGWTGLSGGTPDRDIPSAGLLIHTENRVIIAWDASSGSMGRAVVTQAELLALPCGAILRCVKPFRDPAWPNIIRRIDGVPGHEFSGVHGDTFSAGTASRHYGNLTVIWAPGGELPAPPPLDLARLKALAETVPERRWTVWENTHCDPVVVETGGLGTFKEICRVSTRFADYGRNINAFIAAMDPETVLALIALAETEPTPCRCGDMLRDTTIQCPSHPNVRRRTVRERIDFEQAFDAALERSKHKDEE